MKTMDDTANTVNTNNNDSEMRFPVEVAYRRPGGVWRRTTCRTTVALDKVIDRESDKGSEINVREAE